MTFIDWFILSIYLLFSLFLGIYVSLKNHTEEDYFIAGRRLNGLLAGMSMAATTFSIDTPLYVAGIIGTRGLSANWEWWSFGLAHVAMTVVFAPLWRRSGVLTDAAFTELRYGGPPAAWLRGVKAFLLAVPLNCIGIGYAFLAMRKVAEALGIVDGHYIFGLVSDTLIFLAIVGIFLLVYTIIGGLWAVVVNDFFQLVLALLGALTLAYFVLNASGGMSELLLRLDTINRPELISFFPWVWDQDGFKWIDQSGISVTTFIAFISLQWWSFRRSDGGGEFIQRLLATKNEREATLAGYFFLIINYLIRSWLWIIVALCALVLLPNLEDYELSYPILAIKFLPPIALGLIIVSLVSAFMSTVSTSVNWGASYLTHDIYQRFIKPNAGQRELLLVGQIASLLLLIVGIITALISDSIASIFRLVIAIGTGPGIVLVLRWFWWRINAIAELAAMLSGFILGCVTSLVPILKIDDYGTKLIFTTFCSALIWVIALLLTPPESEEVLKRFVTQVRPPGPGWKDCCLRFGVKPIDSLNELVLRFIYVSIALFGGLLSIGYFLLHQQRGGWIGLSLSVVSILLMRKKIIFSRVFSN